MSVSALARPIANLPAVRPNTTLAFDKAGPGTPFQEVPGPLDVIEPLPETGNPSRAEAPVPPEDPMVLAKARAERSLDKVMAFYKDVLDLDPSAIGGRPEIVMEPDLNNAYWDGEKLHLGMGDGEMFSPLVTTDVLGRETSHALNARTANLKWSGQSGAIGSAMADILATAAEWKSSQTDPLETFDYMLGEDCYTPGMPGDAVRYLDDPMKDGVSIDNTSLIDESNATDLYKLSGIVNNAFYLAANGGQNRTSGAQVAQGIGVEKAAKIFYKAMSQYLTRDSNFSDMRFASILAACDLYGSTSPEAKTVEKAWGAVGVWPPSEPPAKAVAKLPQAPQAQAWSVDECPGPIRPRHFPV